jgi:plasmid stabilization system protein ParE
MKWERSEFVHRDLQSASGYIRRKTPAAARVFVEAAFETFHFIAQQPGTGRPRDDLRFPRVRSSRSPRFRSFLVLYRALPDRVQSRRVLHGARDLSSELR